MKTLTAVFIFSVITAVYWGAVDNDFVNVDDGQFVYNNPHIKSLTPYNLKKLTGIYIYWMPATWLSHSITYQFSGLNPAGHHLVNVLLHAANGLLLFFLFLDLYHTYKKNPPVKPFTVTMTAAGVALLWALHPLRVEAVAWVAERKEVLCTLFMIPALMFYLRARRGTFNWSFYMLSLLMHVLALSSKPMAMTLPGVLLLLDVWPLKRITKLTDYRKLARLCVEKTPFIVASMAIALISIQSEQSIDELASPAMLDFGQRLLHAVRSLSFYIEKTIWPGTMVLYYPVELYAITSPPVLFSLFVISLAAAWSAYRWVFLKKFGFAVTFGFYFITVFPVLGLLKVGNQIRTDHWAYVPTIGFYLALGIAFIKLLSQLSSAHRRKVARGMAVAIVLTTGIMSYSSIRQIEMWADSKSLWTANIEAYPRRVAVAHSNLGNVVPPEQAKQHYKTAISLDPERAVVPRNNLGTLYVNEGNIERAEELFRQVLTIAPEDFNARNNLANICLMLGQREEARAHYEKALEINPDYPDAHYNYSMLLLGEGDTAKAGQHLSRVLQLRPEDQKARYQLALLAEADNRTEVAIRLERELLDLNPQHLEARIHLGVLLFNAGKHHEALQEFLRAEKINSQNSLVVKNMGLIYYTLGQTEQAATSLKRAKQLGASIDPRLERELGL